MTHIRQKLALCCVGFFRLSFRLLSCLHALSQLSRPLFNRLDLAFAHESQLPVSCAERSRQLSRFVGSTSNLGNLGRIKFADLLSRDRVAGNAASDRRQLIEGMKSLQQPVDQQHDCCKIEAKCPSSTLDIAALA